MKLFKLFTAAALMLLLVSAPTFAQSGHPGTPSDSVWNDADGVLVFTHNGQTLVPKDSLGAPLYEYHMELVYEVNGVAQAPIDVKVGDAGVTADPSDIITLDGSLIVGAPQLTTLGDYATLTVKAGSFVEIPADGPGAGEMSWAATMFATDTVVYYDAALLPTVLAPTVGGWQGTTLRRANP